jgi:hypothetical protein
LRIFICKMYYSYIVIRKQISHLLATISSTVHSSLSCRLHEFVVASQYFYPKSFLHQLNVSSRKTPTQKLKKEHILPLYYVLVRVSLVPGKFITHKLHSPKYMLDNVQIWLYSNIEEWAFNVPWFKLIKTNSIKIQLFQKLKTITENYTAVWIVVKAEKLCIKTRYLNRYNLFYT